MRIDRQNQSVHCFNSIAVKDRIDLSTFADETLLSPLSPDASTANILLPSVGDDAAMMSNFLFLIKKVVCEHINFFNTSCSDVLDRHLKHKYSEEMARKSEVVSYIDNNSDVLIK